MNYKNSGQIFPFCLFLIVILLTLIISNFEIGFVNLRKIQQQKKLDGMSLIYATDYARALNGLAGLNEGLRIAAQRGQMMATAFTLLGACAPFVPACAKAFSRLSSEIKPFYDKLNKLGKKLAEQQEQIISWMIQSRQSFPLLSMFEQFYLYPNFGKSLQNNFKSLPFFRPEQNYDSDIKGISKCKTQVFLSYEQYRFQTQVLASSHFKEEVATTDLTYISNNKQYHFEKPETVQKAAGMPFSMFLKTGNKYELFHFEKATLQFCSLFKRLYGSLDHKLPFVFDIPAPLIFKNDFFQEKNRMIFIGSSTENSIFKNIHPEQFKKLPSKTWGLSEVKIDGDNFQKMNFKPHLAAISLQEKLWHELIQKKGFQSWPNLMEISNEIAH